MPCFSSAEAKSVAVRRDGISESCRSAADVPAGLGSVGHRLPISLPLHIIARFGKRLGKSLSPLGIGSPCRVLSANLLAEADRHLWRAVSDALVIASLDYLIGQNFDLGIAHLGNGLCGASGKWRQQRDDQECSHTADYAAALSHLQSGKAHPPGDLVDW